MPEQRPGRITLQARYRRSIARVVEERAAKELGGATEVRILRAVIESKGPCCPMATLLMVGAVGVTPEAAQVAFDRLCETGWLASWNSGTTAFRGMGWEDHSATLTPFAAEQLGLELIEPEEEHPTAKARWRYIGDDPHDFWHKFGRHCCQSAIIRVPRSFGAGPLDKMIEHELELRRETLKRSNRTRRKSHKD